MSAISSTLSAVEPWSYATGTHCCDTVTHAFFGLNDPLSQTTTDSPHIVPGSNRETANFDNPHSLSLHCLKYGEYVRSIPAPHDQPAHCDFILYADNKRCFLLVELKVTSSSGTRVRQLRDSLQSLLAVTGVNSFVNGFQSKRCCYFRRTPPSPTPNLLAISTFNRPARRVPKGGKQVTNPQQTLDIETHGFELWHFSDNDVCQLV